MKKSTLGLLMLLFFGKSFSQTYIINVQNVQEFEHPIMETNKAIKEDKLIYKDGGTTNSKFTFDLDKMKLYRNMNGLEGEFDIMEKKSDNSIFNVWVKFPNDINVNYIFQKEDDNLRTLFCRWSKEDKIVGWFDRTL